MKESLKAYIDLTRAHFSFCWPLLFCTTLLLAFQNYGGFSWSLLLRAALLGLFGLEAGFVLNDYVDREIDKRDVEFDKLTRYWRPFKKRPLPSGLILPRTALGLFSLLVVVCLTLVATIPLPNALYLVAIMGYSYIAEIFYQLKKRDQKLPLAQVVGRTDFALFPVAGYLCHGHPDKTALLMFAFFYTWALAHLGVNDLVDIRNDQARDMKSIAVLYGVKGTAYWILLFTILHVLVFLFFLMEMGTIALIGVVIGLALLGIANYRIMKERSSEAGLKVLPIFHVTMAIYVSSLILDFLL